MVRQFASSLQTSKPLTRKRVVPVSYSRRTLFLTKEGPGSVGTKTTIKGKFWLKDTFLAPPDGARTLDPTSSVCDFFPTVHTYGDHYRHQYKSGFEFNLSPGGRYTYFSRGSRLCSRPGHFYFLVSRSELSHLYVSETGVLYGPPTSICDTCPGPLGHGDVSPGKGNSSRVSLMLFRRFRRTEMVGERSTYEFFSDPLLVGPRVKEVDILLSWLYVFFV